MGFRSVVVSSHNGIAWPIWFVEKYKNHLLFAGITTGTFFTPTERKWYYSLTDLAADIQKVLAEFSENNDTRIVLIWLHECGGITRTEISRDKIAWSEPAAWRRTKGITHEYCYGCSDIPDENPVGTGELEKGDRT